MVTLFSHDVVVIMKRVLLLLRHGKSNKRAGAENFDQPLRRSGKRKAQRMGVYMERHGSVPDYVITSSASCALVTAEKTCKVMGIDPGTIKKDRRIYTAGLDELLEVLRGCPKNAKRVMLVGHNPGLEALLLYLAGGSELLPENSRLIPTAALARLSMPTSWEKLSNDCARLESITRSKALPKKFPFPSHDGEELRKRPSYYYTQSSVIPYRIRKGKPEVLIILSSRLKHWVVPKGIKEPGLTARQSAAKEAWEEAGVEGKVGHEMLGSYQYQKWGASCTVHVYPMEVEKIISEKEWEEAHRGRKWIAPEQAVQSLKQPELVGMIHLLAKKIQN